MHMSEEASVSNTVKKTTAKKAPAKRTAKKPAAKPLTENKELMAEYGDVEVPAIDVITHSPKALVFMKIGASYKTASGVLFTKEHPFQLLDFFEADVLLNMPEDRFAKASPEEARSYYSK